MKAPQEEQPTSGIVGKVETEAPAIFIFRFLKQDGTVEVLELVMENNIGFKIL